MNGELQYAGLIIIAGLIAIVAVMAMMFYLGLIVMGAEGSYKEECTLGVNSTLCCNLMNLSDQWQYGYLESLQEYCFKK